MTHHSGSVLPPPPPEGLIPLENNRVLTVPVKEVIVDGPRRTINEAKVLELMQSILCVGLLNPIIVVARKREGEADDVRLVAGLHRLQATRQLGIANIQCTVLNRDEALAVELAEIDENFIRHDLSPARHALLTQRRTDIIQEMGPDDSTLSQFATASKQALRRARQMAGRNVASVRDQAEKTGETKDKIQRSRVRARMLGRDLLERILDTSLDVGVELDALGKLPEAEQNDLADRAAAGETVSARTANRSPRAKPDPKSTPTRRDKAHADFRAWKAKYADLQELAGLGRQITEIELALSTQ